MRAISPGCAAKNAPVAQLDRALDYESRGQEFESLRARQKSNKYRAFHLQLPDRYHKRYLKRCAPVNGQITSLRWLCVSTCVPKTKSERIDDEVRPRWRAKLWRR